MGALKRAGYDTSGPGARHSSPLNLEQFIPSPKPSTCYHDLESAAPMFAGMRGVHQQMLSGGTLTATSISGLGSFGHHLTTSLPTLPPDRKPSTPISGLGPPPTSLPTPVPPPSTSTTVHSYYDHMI
ncbi:hypothetical protein RR48_15170 [Papilio machaon]|uniref:Uncharacterized protein n=1 Tax=Papilio machaon TaxID=76193 RepID=A0A194QUN0_PAPMA|nr:hypothetical protein RR48_15170 [Papilio machaon]